VESKQRPGSDDAREPQQQQQLMQQSRPLQAIGVQPRAATARPHLQRATSIDVTKTLSFAEELVGEEDTATEDGAAEGGKENAVAAATTPVASAGRLLALVCLCSAVKSV
jgi:hypothetical protein